MKKIVFHLNCLERGGAERVVANLSRQFAAHGYQVYIATEWQGTDEYEIDNRIQRVHVGLSETQKKHCRVKQFFDRILNLRKFLKEVQPDIVLAFARRANYRALTAAVGTKIPVVISIRNNPIGYYDAWSDKIQIALLFGRAAGCVFQTPEQKAYFPKRLQAKSRIILNPINEKFIGNPIPQEREKTVVHSGRLVAFKNQSMLIEAFLQVHQKHPDYTLKIFGGDAGDGTREHLEQLIAKNQAAEFICLMGSSSQLEKDLRCGAAAAFSSNYEGMPNVMLEAMALGLPVVATDCPPGGPRMVIRSEENGLLVPIKDPDALAAAINRLIEDRDFAEKLGREAAKIGETASADTIFLEWKAYIEEICGRQKT